VIEGEDKGQRDGEGKDQGEWWDRRVGSVVLSHLTQSYREGCV